MDERQHLPLRCLPGIVAAIQQAMRQGPSHDQFEYARATDDADAPAIAADQARFIAGGTNLVDLMKYDVERPTG